VARAISTAALSLGLVSIPVGLYPTRSRAGRVSYHLVHKTDGSRVKRQWICEEEGTPVPDDELARSYEDEEGAPVIMTGEEAKQAAPAATGRIDLIEFVPASSIDPVYLDNAYWLGPGRGGDRAYHLLADLLRDLDVVGIGTQVARGKSYLVMVRATSLGLAMHTLHYADEIRAEDEVPHGDRGKLGAAERQMGRTLIEQQLRERFDPSQFEDEAEQQLRAAIAAHAKARPAAAPAGKARGKAPAVDLVAQLEASLSAMQGHDGHGRARAGGRSHAPPRRATTRSRGDGKKAVRARTTRAHKSAKRTD